MGGQTKILAVCFALLPAVVQAQASIAGLVKDSSGAVLAGVTVEAASPALIEKVRSAVTDGNGNYRIIDLVGGVYSVTFALPSFSTARRDGIELIGSFTATVNVELRPGGLEEIITVSGVAPVVDVASPQRQQVLDREVITQLPVSQTYFGLAALSPGINVAAAARIQEIDLTIAKVLRFMGKRATAGFEIFNVTNSSAILTYNNSYTLTGSNNWGQPTGLVPPRYAKFSIQVDF